MLQMKNNRDWHKSASLTPSLLHGGSRRVEDAHSLLEQFNRETVELQKRKSMAQKQLVETLRDELEDSVSVLQRRQEEVQEFIRRCSTASQSINHSAGEKMQSLLGDIDAIRDILDRKEEEVRKTVMESLESRLGLLDEQLRTFSMAAPETDELIRKVQGFLDMADQEALIQNSKSLIAEIERMSDRISRLPSPSDKEPFDHIGLADCKSVERAVSSLKVEQLPTVYYIVPCTGNVCGGTNIRLEGHNLAGEDVKVFIGGLLCEHVTVRSPGGGTTVTCTLPPCQGELEVDVIVEVNGKQAFGGPRFLYSTPAPFVQKSAATFNPTYSNNAIVVPIRGTGFANVSSLNKVELRAADEPNGQLGAKLPYEIISAQDEQLQVSIPTNYVEQGRPVFASVEVVGVSSGDPVLIGHFGNLDHATFPPPLPARSPATPHRRSSELEADGNRSGSVFDAVPSTIFAQGSAGRPEGWQSGLAPRRAPSEAGSVSAAESSISGRDPARGVGGGEPGSRLLRTEQSFGPGSGQTHFAMRIDAMGQWGMVGVALVDAWGEMMRYTGEDRGQGWFFQSDGVCFCDMTGERVDSGEQWGVGDTPGVTVDFDTRSITFSLNGRFVRSFVGLDGVVVALIELDGVSSRATFMDAQAPRVPDSARAAAMPLRHSASTRSPPPAQARSPSPVDLAARFAGEGLPSTARVRGRVPVGVAGGHESWGVTTPTYAAARVRGAPGSEMGEGLVGVGVDGRRSSVQLPPRRGSRGVAM